MLIKLNPILFILLVFSHFIYAKADRWNENITYNQIIERAKKLISIYEDMAELIRLGAYREGSDPKVDEAIHYYESIEGFISQRKNEYTSLDDCYSNLASILDLVYEPEALSKNINELPKPSG